MIAKRVSTIYIHEDILNLISDSPSDNKLGQLTTRIHIARQKRENELS